MVAPISSARVGSGGISIDVTMNVDPARAKLAELRTATSEAVKNLRVAPKIDFEEAQFTRGLDAAVRRIQQQGVKVRIAAELDRQGLGQIAREIGVIRDSAVAASTSPRTNAAIRDAEFSRIRGNFGSLGAANAEAAKRNALEGKFADKLAEEGGGGGLMSLVKGGAIAVAIEKGIETAAGFGRIGQGIGSAFLSSDVNNRRAGVLGAVQGAESLPIVGGLIGSFDKLWGITESLNRAMSARVEIETTAVSVAALSGSPVAAVRAQQNFDVKQQIRGMEGLAHPFADPVSFARTAVSQLTGSAAEEARLFIARMEKNEDLLKLATREETAARRGLSTTGYVASLQRGRTPLAAQRAALAGQLANDLTLAPDYLKSYTASRNAAVLGNFDFQQAFDIGNLNFQSSTRIGAATLRARNHGVRLADEDALTTLRGLQYNINVASNDTAYRQGTTAYTFKDVATAEAIADARALKASLLPRGGAVAGAVNPIGTRIGDPYGIIPEIAARGRAMSFTEGALARWGGAGSGTGFPSAYPVGGGPNGDDRVDLALRLLQDIRDALGGAYDAGSN